MVKVIMVQEFWIVRCYSCEAFQVDQVKKSSNKWSCKICHEKQSVKRVYFRGIAKDCRINCQQLNAQRHELSTKENSKYLEEEEEEEDYSAKEILRETLTSQHENSLRNTTNHYSVNNGNSRWQTYLPESPEKDEESLEDDCGIAFRDTCTKYSKTKRKVANGQRKPYNRCENSLKDNMNVKKTNNLCSTSVHSTLSLHEKINDDVSENRFDNMIDDILPVDSSSSSRTQTNSNFSKLLVKKTFQTNPSSKWNEFIENDFSDEEF